MSEELEPISEAPDAQVEIEASEPGEAGSIEATMAEAYDRANAPRESNGQFARLPNEFEIRGTPDDVPETDDQQLDDDINEADEAESETEEIEEAPQSWNAKAKELWAKVPKELREYISQRDLETRRKISEHGEEGKLAREFNAITDKWREAIPRTPDGREIPPHVAYDTLLSAHAALERNPVAGLQWLAQSYGIDLAQLGADPHADQRRQQEFEAQQQHLAAQAYAQQQEHAAITSLVDSWAADKLDHLPELNDALAYHTTALRAVHPEMPHQEVLQRAYERALRDHPDIADRLPEGKRQAAARTAEARRRAAEAKRAASLNAKSKSGNSPSPSLSWEESMSEVYDRMQARG